MVNATAIDRRLDDVPDPRMQKAMSEIDAERANSNEFGAAVTGISSKAVYGNFEDSLRLLCATLKNQDPTNPMDTDKIATQFATVAQTQAAVEIKELLQKMAGSSEVTKMLEAAKQLDSLVTIKGDTFSYSKNEPIELGFYAPPEAETASYIITDSQGQVVRIIEGPCEKTTDGYHGLVWDGKDNQGNDAKPGKYKFAVSLIGSSGDVLRNTKGEPLVATTTIMGRVHGSDLKGGHPRFAIAGHHYDMSGLISVQSADFYREKVSLGKETKNETKGEADIGVEEVDSLIDEMSHEGGHLAGKFKQQQQVLEGEKDKLL